MQSVLGVRDVLPSLSLSSALFLCPARGRLRQKELCSVSRVSAPATQSAVSTRTQPCEFRGLSQRGQGWTAMMGSLNGARLGFEAFAPTSPGPQGHRWWQREGGLQQLPPGLFPLSKGTGSRQQPQSPVRTLGSNPEAEEDSQIVQTLTSSRSFLLGHTHNTHGLIEGTVKTLPGR